MCIVFLWRRKHGSKLGAGKLKLVIAANRDEFFHRPAKDANFWDEDSNVIGGRDMTEGVSGGTWLAMSKTGRVAMLTNIRTSMKDMAANQSKTGRGSLISDYLLRKKDESKGLSPHEYMASLESTRLLYKPFNLICGSVTNDNNDGGEFYYSTSADIAPPMKIDQEAVCISNGTLNCGWLKVEKSREKFEKVLADFSRDEPSALIDPLLDLMANKEENFPDEKVTVDNPWNKYLSSIFIPMVPEHNYGTRTNTVIIVDENDHVWFCERTMTSLDKQNPDQWRKSIYQFDLVKKE